MTARTIHSGRVFLLTTALALVATSVWAQKVTADWDKTVNFTAFKTYAWTKGTIPENANPLTVQRVVASVEAELSAIGLVKVDKDPDLLVAVHGATKEDVSLDAWGYGYYPRWGGGGGRIDVNKVLVGTLMVDLIDSRARRAVFRGTATDTVSDNPQKNEKKIHKAVEKIFQKYPGNVGTKP